MTRINEVRPLKQDDVLWQLHPVADIAGIEGASRLLQVLLVARKVALLVGEYHLDVVVDEQFFEVLRVQCRRRDQHDERFF